METYPIFFIATIKDWKYLLKKDRYKDIILEGLAFLTFMQRGENTTQGEVRDELGINEISKAKPLQAALASGLAFIMGGVLPTLTTSFLPINGLAYYLYGFAIFFLILLGALAAKAGGSSITKAIFRITLWGTIAMGLSAFVGYLFGVNI